MITAWTESASAYSGQKHAHKRRQHLMAATKSMELSVQAEEGTAPLKNVWDVEGLPRSCLANAIAPVHTSRIDCSVYCWQIILNKA